MEKISRFLGRELSEAALHDIVEKTTFKNMKKDPKASYEFLPEDLLKKGQFMRKGQSSHAIYTRCNESPSGFFRCTVFGGKFFELNPEFGVHCKAEFLRRSLVYLESWSWY